MGRTFTVEKSCIKASGGRYNSSSPSAAAKKAATKLFQKAKKSKTYKSLKKITFTIRETTVGSDKTEYNYSAVREKLKKPVERVINGVTIVNEYKINIKAV